MNVVLENWNHMEFDEAVRTIVPCNGATTWARQMVAARPFATPEECFAMSDEVWSALSDSGWQEAFDSHPRIGERAAKTATPQSLSWSLQEQSASANEETIKAALAIANEEYEAKFGRIFIVCATGKTAAEMLGILEERLTNDPATELQEAAEQQRRITQLRLRKWLSVG